MIHDGRVSLLILQSIFVYFSITTRYMLHFTPPILRRHELDAFLAQSVSPILNQPRILMDLKVSTYLVILSLGIRECPQIGQQYRIKNKTAIAQQCKCQNNSCLALYLIIIIIYWFYIAQFQETMIIALHKNT